MSKLDSKPMQHAQLSKNSHDLSHTFDFTSSTGMILPLEHDLLNPGESIECKVDLSHTRTMPLQAAAYLDLDLHVDYFFVPLTILYSPFESFIYRINDYYSSARQGASMISLPLLDVLDYKQSVVEVASSPVDSMYPATKNFDQLGKGCLRLLEHLGFGNLETGVKNYNPVIFPYQLLAYNAIYQYYFRNDEFEKFDSASFNVDDPEYAGVIPATRSSHLMFELKYRDKYHDYFTSLKASPIVSGNNLLESSGSLSLAKSWLSRTTTKALQENNLPVIRDGFHGVDDAFASPNQTNRAGVRTNFGFGAPNNLELSSTSTLNSPNGFDINTANLRALFANEKLWTITGMNRKQYDAQTLAHFGYDVPTDIMHQVQHLGHHVFNVSVGEVISTAGTTAQPLATVAGKGYAFDNNAEAVRFTAPCHGVFMAVYSSAIKRNYFNNFRKENAIADWQDFYQPEFDHLGMQPMFLFETMQTDYVSNPASVAVTPFGTIIGWQYRYEQFKRRYDRATPAFSYLWINNGQALESTYGPFSSWSATDQAFEGNDLSEMTFIPSDAFRWCLKETPIELNSLMAVSYDPAWYQNETLNYLHRPDLAFGTDPLVHHALIHYKKLSTMSNFSMPKED